MRGAFISTANGVETFNEPVGKWTKKDCALAADQFRKNLVNTLVDGEGGQPPPAQVQAITTPIHIPQVHLPFTQQPAQTQAPIQQGGQQQMVYAAQPAPPSQGTQTLHTTTGQQPEN